ncbi:MAG: PQQ-binding-like beta-propeller repeat protein, partial [Planctomycetota bacterium]
MKIRTFAAAMLVGCGLIPVGFDSGNVQAEWTSFRNGGASVTETLPTEWNPKSTKWQLELTGYGQSTPVIFGDHVFVASVVGGMKENCLIQCIGLTDGKEHWRFEMPSAKQSASNYMASRAAPTPVVDQDGVYVFFETGDLVCVDLSGQKVWHRNLSEEFGDFENNHGLGSSPAHNKTHLFINLEHRGPSHLVAVRKENGESDWNAERPSGSSWSSPIVVEQKTGSQVIVSSAGSVSSYDAASGAELWAVDGLDGNSVPSPTVHDGKLFIGARLPEFAEEGSIRSNCCLDIANSAGKTPEVLWRAEKAISDYASPVVVGDYVYFINKVGVLHCLDAANGKLHYRKRLEAPSWATPIVCGEKLYLFGKDGSTQVVEAGEEFKLVATNQLWDPENPPKPEQYVEFTGGGHGHGSHGAPSGSGHGSTPPKGGKSAGPQGGDARGSAESAAPSRRPGGGMMAAL